MDEYHILLLCWIILIDRVFTQSGYHSSCYTRATGDTYCLSSPGTNNELNTLSAAQNWCRNNNSHLVEITDDSIQASVASFIQERRFIIVNAQRIDFSSWYWLTGPQENGYAVDGQDYGYTRYAYLMQQPGNASRVQFVADLPTNKRGFICQYNDKFASCRGQPNSWSYSGRCYLPTSEQQDWFNASIRCKQFLALDLASFDGIPMSSINATWVQTWLSSTQSYWTGLLRSQWIWQTSNASVTYTNWRNGQPYNINNKCLYIDTLTNNQWTDANCESGDRSYSVVCLTDGQSTTTAASTITTTTTGLSLPPDLTGSSTVSNFSTQTSSSEAVTHNTLANLAMPIGVGIGAGLLLVIVIIIIIVVLIRCKKRRRKKKSADTNSLYAQVVAGDEGRENGASQADPIEHISGKELVYANLEFNQHRPHKRSRQSLQPPDVLPEYTEAYQIPSVLIGTNGDIYTARDRDCRPNVKGNSTSAVLTGTTSI